MKTKLTLTIEDSVIRKARLYARNTGRSLPELVQNHLEALVEMDIDRSTLSPKLRRIAGIVKLPPDFNERPERNF